MTKLTLAADDMADWMALAFAKAASVVSVFGIAPNSIIETGAAWHPSKKKLNKKIMKKK
jgi:hypothetical protein